MNERDEAGLCRKEPERAADDGHDAHQIARRPDERDADETDERQPREEIDPAPPDILVDGIGL